MAPSQSPVVQSGLLHRPGFEPGSAQVAAARTPWSRQGASAGSWYRRWVHRLDARRTSGAEVDPGGDAGSSAGRATATRARGRVDGVGTREAGADRRLELAAVVGFTLLALGLRLFQVLRGNYLFGLTEYDDGVYFGAAVRIVHGVLPYRDFVLVHPPGLEILMSPIAWLSRYVGTRDGLAIARVVTAFVGAANTALVGAVVRRRGLVVTVVACAIMAAFPDAVQAAHTLMLGPYLDFFCLLGALLAFRKGVLADGSRLVWAGVAFGFAGTVKVWAILPVVVVLVLCLPSLARLVRYGLGVAAGFLVPAGYFIAQAPLSFLHDVIVVQLIRIAAVRLPVDFRLASMTGLDGFTPVSAHEPLALDVSLGIAGFLVVVFVVTALRRGGRPDALEWFALGSTAVVTAAFLWPADYYNHYAAFLAPFLALSMAFAAGRVAALLRMVLVPGALVAGLASLCGLALVAAEGYHLSTVPPVSPFGASAEALIPPGACVLTDWTSMVVLANRFVSTDPDCPKMVDSFGTGLALGNGRPVSDGGGRLPAVWHAWLADLEHAQFVWFSSPTTNRVPFVPPVVDYLETHFRRVPGTPLDLYERISSVPPG